MVGTENEHTRDAWVKEQLLALPAGLAILDAGAGEQKYKKFCSHLKYTSQDFCEYDGAGNGKGGQMGEWDVSNIDIVSDIINIPCADKSFDVILCTEVLEHLPHPELAIKEFSRLLKQDGCLILTAPFCSLTHFAPYHYMSGFNRYWYENILNENGLKVLSITPNGNYFEYLAQEIRRIPYMTNKYSTAKWSRWRNVVIKGLLAILENISACDRDSAEVLCFGYHVVGKKVS